MVEEYTGFEESRYLIEDYVEVLERSKTIDLSDEVAVEKWWKDYHLSNKCFSMIDLFKVDDTSYQSVQHRRLRRIVFKKVLNFNTINYAAINQKYSGTFVTLQYLTLDDLINNYCDVPINRYRDFLLKYLRKVKYREFTKFNKSYYKKYGNRYKDIYDEVSNYNK